MVYSPEAKKKKDSRRDGKERSSKENDSHAPLVSASLRKRNSFERASIVA